MKLSEILGWEKKRSENQEMVGVTNASLNSVVNTALTSCDREIDREALAKVIQGTPKIGMVNKWNIDWDWSVDIADHIISTMPTWLKRIEE